MNLKKIFFSVLTFLFISINFLNAEDKVSYIDIDNILTNTHAGKLLLTALKEEENSKIDKFKLTDQDFKNDELKILAKKNLISKQEINKSLKELNIKYQDYKKNKIKEIESLKSKRNRNIVRFLNLINPIIEKYMAENSIYILMDKKNVFIASKDYDITNNLIELIDNQIKTFEIK
mgnify:CR=1 FL=1